MKSFKPEVQTASDGETWTGNGLRFATQDEAEQFVFDLWHRWMAVTATRVIPSDDEVTHRWVTGEGLAAIGSMAEPTMPKSRVLLGLIAVAILCLSHASASASNTTNAAPAYLGTSVTNAPSYTPRGPRNLDWHFLTAHAISAGATAFDGYTTSRGLNQPCGFVEGNEDLGTNPSDKKLAVHLLVEYAAVTTMDYFLKKTHVPGLSYVGAAIATGKHVRGGMMWVHTGCL